MTIVYLYKKVSYAANDINWINLEKRQTRNRYIHFVQANLKSGKKLRLPKFNKAVKNLLNDNDEIVRKTTAEALKFIGYDVAKVQSEILQQAIPPTYQKNNASSNSSDEALQSPIQEVQPLVTPDERQKRIGCWGLACSFAWRCVIHRRILLGFDYRVWSNIWNIREPWRYPILCPCTWLFFIAFTCNRAGFAWGRCLCSSQKAEGIDRSV